MTLTSRTSSSVWRGRWRRDGEISTRPSSESVIRLSLCSAGPGVHTPSYDLSIIGGYKDERGTSNTITSTLLDLVISSQTVFKLVVAVMGDINTEYRAGLAWPRVYGGGVHLRTGDVFCARFSDHGPDQDIRLGTPLLHSSTATGAEIIAILLGLWSARVWRLFIIFMIPSLTRWWCSTTGTTSPGTQRGGWHRLMSSYWHTSLPVLQWSLQTSVIK